MATTIVLNDMRTAPTAAARSPTEQGRRPPRELRQRCNRLPTRGFGSSSGKLLRRHIAGIASHDYHAAGFGCHIRSGADCDTDVRGHQRGGIVESHRRPSQRTSLAAARYRSSGLLTWLVLDCSTGAGERDARVTALADHDRLD